MISFSWMKEPKGAIWTKSAQSASDSNDEGIGPQFHVGFAFDGEGGEADLGAVLLGLDRHGRLFDGGNSEEVIQAERFSLGVDIFPSCTDQRRVIAAGRAARQDFAVVRVARRRRC